MKNYKFAVYFGNWSEIEIVYAGNVNSAAILAKAARINKGRPHKVSSVDIWDDKKMDFVFYAAEEEIVWN
jgi:hypothetical protein